MGLLQGEQRSSAYQNLKIGESQKLHFRFSAYNFLNHPITSFTGGSELNPSFNAQSKGVIGGGFGYANSKLDRRVLQMAVKFYFLRS